MEHLSHKTHLNTETAIGKSFRTGIIINVLFIAIEIIYGFLSNSMALIADAGHNLIDVLALIFSWIAVLLSERKPTLRFTYGFRRSTILIALLNTILLLVAVGVILLGTIERIGMSINVSSDKIIAVASLGILVNGFTAWLFMKDKKHDLNVRSAFLHFIADTLVSCGVVLAGVLISLTGIVWIDSLTSIIIALVILYSSYHLLIDSVNLALDAVPENINIQAVSDFLQGLKEVSGIHDLHIWALSTTEAALTVHLSTSQQTDKNFITSIQRQLHEKFGIHHTTIQVEFGPGEMECETNCN